ncbi:MAG: cob(I)yrinic acid a,c-diamide adenosyltransferase [Bacteroidaceae bacterium]|nr:cob(I)yrinic acid a,c-diamide adenosyltransferase [Bacteroidaceae bacterium]
MKKCTLYTRKGDSGRTTIVGGKAIEKDHCRIEAYGTIDELNANLGLLAASMENHPQRDFIEAITNNLFSIGSYLATEDGESPVDDKAISELEVMIDNIDDSLPKLHSFVLPPTTEAAARANVCRCVCRRAERRITTLAKKCLISTKTTAYINRLSDYLFALSRLLNNGEEKTWEKCWK